MILCCGEALVDLVQRDEEGGNVFRAYNGGGIYNTAIALGRLGEQVGLFGGMSKDVFGESLRAQLRAAHVSEKFLRIKDRHTTLAIVKVNAEGNAHYFFIDDASAGRWIEKKDMPKLASTIKALMVGGIHMASEPAGSTYEAFAKKAAKNHVIAMDPNVRPPHIKDRKKFLARLSRMIAISDILKISDDDVKWVTGSSDLTKAAKSFLKKGAKIVAITRGGAGCHLFTTRFSFDAAAPAVKVADTVGAGDTFNAGLLHALNTQGLFAKKAIAEISEEQLKTAANYAMRAAAVTVSRPGADPPWAHEMQ
ncbi:carbohydrate kinase family protein [Aestuariivirga litoralis]|uniref:carbohydrate kinase family protein n=1 Tax=Aestuariivirga litoralis TaxID=2650924 RepID=UPI0018C5C330|nr:carbohydrate kinase [Aestuariivirga litoralis]MBG1232897.1 carbohydrate kinase [Aestuariivirga litoralis]